MWRGHVQDVQLCDGTVTRDDHSQGVSFPSQVNTACDDETMYIIYYVGDSDTGGHYQVLVDYEVEPSVNKGNFPWMPSRVVK